jgi:hypothetical protein
MDLTLSPNIAVSRKSQWPNTITFPKELKQAIPDYAPRVLVFDSVTGSHYDGKPFSLMIGRMPLEPSVRTSIKLLVHETGKLDGKFNLHVDLDAATTRALGNFLIELADQAERVRN